MDAYEWLCARRKKLHELSTSTRRCWRIGHIKTERDARASLAAEVAPYADTELRLSDNEITDVLIHAGVLRQEDSDGERP